MNDSEKRVEKTVDDAIHPDDTQLDRARGAAFGSRRRFLKLGGALAAGSIVAYSSPKVAFAQARRAMSPPPTPFEFPALMDAISDGCDDFIASSIPIMIQAPINPPDPNLVTNMAANAATASASAKDSKQAYEDLSQELKNLLDLNEVCKQKQAQADAKQADINNKRAAMNAAVDKAIKDPTLDNIADATAKANLLATALDELNDILVALAGAVEDVIGAAGNLVGKVLEIPAAGADLVVGFFSWIGRLFK